MSAGLWWLFGGMGGGFILMGGVIALLIHALREAHDELEAAEELIERLEAYEHRNQSDAQRALDALRGGSIDDGPSVADDDWDTDGDHIGG